jgi:hypothetical protein
VGEFENLIKCKFGEFCLNQQRPQPLGLWTGNKGKWEAEEEGKNVHATPAETTLKNGENFINLTS